MKKISILAGTAICIVDLSSCGTTGWGPPPPVTTEWSRAAARQHVDVRTLRAGRAIFVSRCIECHTLPVVSRYNASDWPCLVDAMSERASLKKSERDAIVAYILAARAQP